MKKNIKTTFLKLSKKKLNMYDKARLYNLLLKLQNNDLKLVKLFLDNYYNVNSLPTELYNTFIYCVHSNRYHELFAILLKRNIYELISFFKNDNEKITDIEDYVSFNDYYELPNKQIKYLVELIQSLDLKNDEILLKKIISSRTEWLIRKYIISTQEEFIKIAIKMYLSVGIDNAVDILLCKYGKVDYEMIYYLFNNLNVKNVNSVHNLIFNDFLFKNKKDPNNNMKLMIEGKFLELFINFDYFFNSIDYFIKQLGIKFNKSKVTILLKERYLAPKLENPELDGIVLDDMISSYYHKYGIIDSENEIIDKNMNAYNLKLKTKTKSSIIKIDLPIFGDFIFDLIPLSDAKNLVMGYRAGNCFRINGDALMLFNNFLTNPHMRILSISTEQYKDFGMVLLMRNGNVLIAQGIEISRRVVDYINVEKLYNEVRKTIKYIMDRINEEDDEIVASIIGLSNTYTSLYNHNILPFLINPILNNNHQYYNGIENYQGLLDLKEGKRISDIKLFVPTKFYHERNSQIYRRDESTLRDSIDYRQIEKILISLRYARFKVTSNEELSYYYSELIEKKEMYTVCTRYWFIMVFEDKSIDTYINSDNPEIVEEYNLELEKIKNNSGSLTMKFKRE